MGEGSFKGDLLLAIARCQEGLQDAAKAGAPMTRSFKQLPEHRVRQKRRALQRLARVSPALALSRRALAFAALARLLRAEYPLRPDRRSARALAQVDVVHDARKAASTPAIAARSIPIRSWSSNTLVFGNRSVGLVALYPAINQQRWVLPIHGGVVSQLAVDTARFTSAEATAFSIPSISRTAA